jgi:hypothetical protein
MRRKEPGGKLQAAILKAQASKGSPFLILDSKF